MPAPELDPSSESALRAAFRTCDIAKRMTFEQAMAAEDIAVCIRTLAQIHVRRITRSPA